MDGFLPMSFALTEASARVIGRDTRQAMLPDLLLISNRLTGIAVDLQALTQAFQSLMVLVEIIDTLGTVRTTGLRVYEINPTLLENVELASIAVRYFSYNQMNEVLIYLGCYHAQLKQVNQNLTALHLDLEDLKNCVCGGIHVEGMIGLIIEAGALSDIAAFIERVVAALNLLNVDVLQLLPNLTAFLTGITLLVWLLASFDVDQFMQVVIGLHMISLFIAILSLAITGIIDALGRLVSTIADAVTRLGALRTIDEAISDVLESLGEFMTTLGKALSSINPQVLEFLPSLNSFIETLGRLVSTIADAVTRLGALRTIDEAISGVLESLGAFMTTLGNALNSINPQVLEFLPSLNSFIETLGRLVSTIAGAVTRLGALRTIDEAISGVLESLGEFMTTLGNALNSISPKVLEFLPNLNNFIETLGRLVSVISDLGIFDQLFGVPAVLESLTQFMKGLVEALNSFDQSVLKALPGLAQFIDVLARLVTAIANLSVLDVLVTLPMGFDLIIKFIQDLGTVLGSFSADVLKALTPLAQLIDALARLVNLFANMGVGQWFAVVAGFGLLSAFIAGLVVACERAKGCLESLAKIIEGIKSIIDSISSLGGSLFGSVLTAGGGGTSALTALLGQASSLQALPIQSTGGLGVGGMVDSAIAPAPQPTTLISATQPSTNVATPASQGASGFSLADLPSALPASLQSVDQSVSLQGGITVNVNAERLEANAVDLITEEFIRQIQNRLGSLRSEQDFGMGGRPTALA